jgi:hypothetical protein
MTAAVRRTDDRAMRRFSRIHPALLGGVVIALGLATIVADASVGICVNDWDVSNCTAGTAMGSMAGGIVMLTGVALSLLRRTSLVVLVASALAATAAVLVIVSAMSDSRPANCYVGLHQPLLAAGQTPVLFPSLDEDGVYCE